MCCCQRKKGRGIQRGEKGKKLAVQSPRQRQGPVFPLTSIRGDGGGGRGEVRGSGSRAGEALPQAGPRQPPPGRGAARGTAAELGLGRRRGPRASPSPRAAHVRGAAPPLASRPPDGAALTAPGRDALPQDVSAGEMLQPEAVGDALAHRALAGAGRAQHDGSQQLGGHGGLPGSLRGGSEAGWRLPAAAAPSRAGSRGGALPQAAPQPGAEPPPRRASPACPQPLPALRRRLQAPRLQMGAGARAAAANGPGSAAAHTSAGAAPRQARPRGGTTAPSAPGSPAPRRPRESGPGALWGGSAGAARSRSRSRSGGVWC